MGESVRLTFTTSERVLPSCWKEKVSTALHPRSTRTTLFTTALTIRSRFVCRIEHELALLHLRNGESRLHTASQINTTTVSHSLLYFHLFSRSGDFESSLPLLRAVCQQYKVDRWYAEIFRSCLSSTYHLMHVSV